MPDIATLSNALSALKSLETLTQEVIHARDALVLGGKLREFQSKLMDANEAVLAAQEERLATLQLVGELEKEVARLKTWDGEKDRYQLAEIAPGAVVYATKKDSERAEPAHWLCQPCYDDTKKAILQAQGLAGMSGPDFGKRWWQCPRCQTKILLPYRTVP